MYEAVADESKNTWGQEGKKWVYTYFRIKICLVLIYFNRSASPDLIPPPSQASFLIHVDGNEHSWASSLRRQD